MLFGFPPTGTEVCIPGVDIFRLVATDGQPQRSRRYRELYLPNGLGPELRVVLADDEDSGASLVSAQGNGG